MGSAFIPSGPQRAWVIVATCLAASANAQERAAITWMVPGATCPLFVQAASEVVLGRNADRGTIEIGGVTFVSGAERSHENLNLIATLAPDETLDLNGSACRAKAKLGERTSLNAEAAGAYARRIDALARADSRLAFMESAAKAARSKEALDAAASACAARREALPAGSALIAECDLHWALRLSADGNPSSGLERSRDAYRAFRALAGDRATSETAWAKEVEARALFSLGRPGDMLEPARESFESRRALLGAHEASTLVSQQLYALGLQGAGRLDDAIAALDEAVQAYATTPGSEGLRAKVNLSAMLQQRGDFDRVVILQREVLDARRKTLRETDPLTVSAVHNLGIALAEAGRPDEALPIIARALPPTVAELGENHPQVLRLKSLLGTIYEGFGREDEALPLYEDVYAIRRSQGGTPSRSLAVAATNMGGALLRLDRPDDALAVADVTLADLAGAPGIGVTATRELHQLRADALLRLGRPREAVDALQALAVQTPTPESIRGADRDHLAALTTWTQAQFELGQREAALASMAVIYEGFRGRFGERHTYTLDAMAMLADMQAQAGGEAEALRLLAQFVEINERMMDEGIAFNPANRGRLAQGVRDRPYIAGYRTYVRLLAPRDPEKALAVAELTKGRSLREALARPRGSVNAVQAAQVRLARAEERVAGAEVGSAAYLKAFSERTLAEEALRSAGAPVSRRSSSIDVSGTARRVISARSVFVEYVVSGDRVLALIADGKGRITFRDLGSIRGVADMVDAFRRVTTSAAPASERIWIFPDGSARWSLAQPQGATRLTDLDAIGRRLSARLLDPLAADIGGATTWIISPDGPLAFLPFEALRINKQLVLETRNVIYTPSLSSLAIMPARVTAGPRWDFLGVGVSNFGSNSSTWRDLPEAEAEVGAIGELFPVSRVLTGAQATEERLRALDTAGELRRYRYVHFATHAFLSDRGTSLSGVVLAGPGASGGDGVITVAEWPTYRLGSDLVVLSACDTGLGRLVAGEGVVGLPSALLAAGSRAVVMSLWSVADASAAEFMPRFYKRLKAGRAPAEALRETKLELARSKGPWSSPRHWAPYVLYGAP